MSLKVFRMNDCDWVVAKEMDEAIDYYEQLTGEKMDEEEIEDIEECDLEKDGQYTDFKDKQRIAELEAENFDELLIPVKKGNHTIDGFGSLRKIDGVWQILVPFKDVLPVEEEFKEPYITASTEY